MSLSDYSDEGYVQDYFLNQRQDLYIYCRACRSTFPVSFKPKRRTSKLRCLCGYEAPLAELDVFQTQREAEAHAELYNKVYRAAKDALRDAGLPLPPSGKYARVDQVHRDPEFTSFYSEEEDASDIRDGYIPETESDASPIALAQGLAAFEGRLANARGIMERHDVLTELVEWAYCRRHFDDEIYERFRTACLQDMQISQEVKREAKRLKKSGQKVRLSFTSFRHLILDFEEAEEFTKALRVAEAALSLGLKSYAEKAARLRARLR